MIPPGKYVSRVSRLVTYNPSTTNLSGILERLVHPYEPEVGFGVSVELRVIGRQRGAQFRVRAEEIVRYGTHGYAVEREALFAGRPSRRGWGGGGTVGLVHGPSATGEKTYGLPGRGRHRQRRSAPGQRFRSSGVAGVRSGHIARHLRSLYGYV